MSQVPPQPQFVQPVQPQYVMIAPSGTNGLGIFGFLVALVGVLLAATLAAVSMSVLLMIAVFDKPGSQDEFVTLTDSSAHSGHGPTLHVVFASDITEADMRAVLLAAGGEIVSGPTSEGIYTIGIAESSDRSSDFDSMLTQLRTNPRVRLAVRNVEISTE